MRAITLTMPRIRLYHGSGDKYEGGVLRAVAPNMGTMLSKPSWSVFFWDNEGDAWRWAIYRHLTRVYNLGRKHMTKGEKHRMLVSYHFPEHSAMVRSDGTEDWEWYLGQQSSRGRKVYVYSAMVEVHAVRPGNMGQVREWTVDSDVSWEKESGMDVLEAFRRYVKVTDPDTWNSYHVQNGVHGTQEKYRFNRGLVALIMKDGDKAWFATRKAWNDGKLKATDDIAAYYRNEQMKMKKKARV
jgi:hypothetical protein